MLLAFSRVNWLRAALGAVAGAVTFLAVAGVVVAAMGALAAAAGVAELSVPVVAGISGCIAGAIAAPVATFTATGSLSTESVLASVIDGCVGGATLGVITSLAASHWLAGVFENLGWDTTAAAANVAGPTLEADAAAAGVELTQIQTETDSAVVALRNYPG